MGKILNIKNKVEEKFLRKATAPFDFKTFSKKIGKIYEHGRGLRFGFCKTVIWHIFHVLDFIPFCEIL